MTVMDPRPWSPAGPHIGPDEEDLAMLDPTGDPEVDLGSVVLAAHRVGAAAAEAVARAPLPDEFRLVDALAAARAAFAAPAVDAVSKCVTSDNPAGYADLLLKDLFDGGEAGALAVYRACVSKGVAPPLAAQRAGLVYGVPHDELGRYLSVAADPKAHPVAIADAADRVVTHWAAGVVRAEMSEVVAKQAPHQTTQQYNTTPFGQEHPKGRAGRFVETLERPSHVAAPPVAGEVAGRPAGLLARLRRDTGVGYQAAPEVAPETLAPPVTAPPIEVPRPVRQVRRVRQTRRVRQEGAPAVATPKLKAQLQSRASARLAPKIRARLDAQRLKATGKPPLATVNFDSDQAEISAQFTQRLDTMLAWSMTVQDANQIFRDAPGAGTYDKPKHVKMGQLQQRLAEPIPWGDQHNQQMRTIAEDASGDELPRFERIEADDLEAFGILPHSPQTTAKDVEEYARLTGLDEKLVHLPSGEYNPLLKGVMSAAPSADGTGDWFLVVNPETVIYGRPEDAPLAAAAEFIVSDPAGNIARVNREGSPDYPYYELDPTQDWIIKEPVTLWKQTGMDTGHWVDRYTVEPLDEDWMGGKAVTTEQRWRTEPRNSLGEWSRTRGGLLARVKTAEAPTTVVTPVVTPIAPRAHRQVRQHRKVRQTVAPTPAEAKLEPVKVQVKLPAKLLRSFHAGLAEEAYEVIDTSVPAWDDRERYVVFASSDWDHLLRKSGWKGFRDEIVPRVPLDGSAREDFLGRMRDAVAGDDADWEVRLHAENELMVRHKDERREIPSLRFHIDDDDEHAGKKWTEVGRRVRSLMAMDHTVQSVRIDPGRQLGDYRVMVNKHPLSDVVVVVLPDDFDPEKPVTLEFTGRARQSALNRNIDRYYDEALHVDAPVQMFRATQATKAIYHARQDER